MIRYIGRLVSVEATTFSYWRAIVFASLCCLLFLADDFIQQFFIEANQAELELRYVLMLWLFALALWLAASRWLVAVILPILAIMQLIQLGNISYFGEPLTPADLTSLFGSFADVYETGVHHFGDHWPVLVAVLLPYSLLMYIYCRYMSPARIPVRLLGFFLVFTILLAKPYRATYRDMDSFMPGPTRSALHNSFNAFAFYAVNLAFRKPVDLQAPSFKPYKLVKHQNKARHVWVVVADSLRADRLGVFGYERNTTPNLSRLQKHQSLLVKPGIASGVSTAVSLPNFINVIREPGQHHLLRQQPHNLFRLAEKSGFKTHWISSQESKLLNFLGSRFIDVSITREDHPLLFARQQDHGVVDLIDRQQWDSHNFVVVNLRTAHSPYENNYRSHDEVLHGWSTDEQLPREQRKANSYDNAVLYLDDLLADIIQRFEQLEGERYLLITADHGQLLGENGRWGHNDLVPQVASVPVMVMARDAPAERLQSLGQQKWVSHYEAGVWLAERLGFDLINPNSRTDEHFLQGKLLLGDNYIQVIRETSQGLQFESPRLLSHWLQSVGASDNRS